MLLFFAMDNKHIIYASTHLGDEKCPETPLRKNGKYIWPVYDTFDIFVAINLKGNIVKQLTEMKKVMMPNQRYLQKVIKLFLPQHAVAI